jgi:hypothetical protein
MEQELGRVITVDFSSLACRMTTRRFPTILTAWHGLIDELAYSHKFVKAIGVGGITTSYPGGLVVDIDDVLTDEGLHLNMSSFGKTRFKQFLKRYFRPDLPSWVDNTVNELGNLKKHQVASYSVSYNPERIVAGREGYGHSQGGHRHGACLGSLQLQHFPEPKVILFSRASQLDKAGFLDLSLMHLVAKRTGWRNVSGSWVVSMAFIAAVSQLFYVRRFNKPLKGHSLEKSTRSFWREDYNDAAYGPQRRSIKKAQQFLQLGDIPRSCSVSELSLEF